MASIHVYVDTRDRQWANPPNMAGLYHAHLDMSELPMTKEAIEVSVNMLLPLLLGSIVPTDVEKLQSNPGQLYEVYDNADGGMRKAE